MNVAFQAINQQRALLADDFGGDLLITEAGDVNCQRLLIHSVETITPAGITGTILTPAQPNITSIGALLSFDATTIVVTHKTN